MGNAEHKVLTFARDGSRAHPSLDDLAPEVRPYLEAAVAGLKSRAEDVPGLGVRLFLGEGELLFSDWTANDLRGCLEDPRPASEAWREVVRTLAFLLKVREDLGSYRSRTPGTEDPGPAFVPMFQRDLDLFADAFERIEDAIDSAVLRGELVGARNLSRFRDLLLPYRLQCRLALDEVRKESEDHRRKLQARQEAVPKTAPAEPATAPAPTRKSRRAAAAAAAAAVGLEASAKVVPHPSRVAAPQGATRRFPTFFVLLLGLVLVRWGMGIHQESVSNPEPSLAPAEVSRVLPADSVFAAGGVLYATAGDEWTDLDPRGRQDRFRRLCETAASRGFHGVVLLNASGDFAARWTKGGVPSIWNR